MEAREVDPKNLFDHFDNDWFMKKFKPDTNHDNEVIKIGCEIGVKTEREWFFLRYGYYKGINQAQ